MGLFKPAWMSNNEEKALRAVESLTDQTELARAVYAARSREARKAAVGKLTDTDALAGIIGDEKNCGDIRPEARRRLEALERAIRIEQIKRRDDEILEILGSTSDPAEGREAFRQISDENKQLRALRHISDQTVLTAVLEHEIHFDIKMKKVNVRADIKNSMEGIMDQSTLIYLFQHALSYCVRVLAMELITDQPVLARALYRSEERIKNEHLLYSQKDEIAMFCTAIIDRITDADLLIDIAQRASSYDNRMEAVKNLTDSGMMIDYIMPVERIRSANEYGNTAGNLNNGGYAAVQGDWIYYSNRGQDGFLYKIRNDGAGKEQLNNDTSSYINVIGEWVYYRNESDKNNLWKVKINGTGKTKLNNRASLNVTVAGNRIFYKNAGENNKIYKIRADGSEETKISDCDCNDIAIAEDSIYYTEHGDYKTLRKISADGTGITNINTGCSGINIAGDWIYYRNYKGCLWKCHTDGSGETQITDDDSLHINVVGDWIYYRNQSAQGNGCLYKIRTNGTGKTKLNNDLTSEINVAGNWIYYINRGDENRLYRIRTNGSERQPVT